MADYVSVLTGGTNNFATTSEHLNSLATDILSDGVVGAVYNTAGVAPMTGGLAVNAQGTPNMTVAVTAGKAYVTTTPSGQASQRLRANIAAQNVTIAANSTGGTRYDWVYVKIDAANAANPNAAGDNVASLVTSRSTSASTDNGTPPTYGYAIAVVTVSNGATSIVNGNIADKRSALTVPSNTSSDGWSLLSSTPNTVTYNGNRSYTLVFNSVDLSSTLSAGQRLKATRTVAAPTQCTSLNGTTQYYSRTSANLGTTMTFTNNFTVSAWIKLSSYSGNWFASRYNGTSGWTIGLNSSGQVSISGLNGGGGNYRQIVSNASVPLNRWVHIAAQLDMSVTTNTPTTSYIMFDGIDIPCKYNSAGTNPTSLIQAGNLEIGSANGGASPFPGKLAQVAIFSAKIPQATMQGYISQGLSGSETSLISAYSFNGVITDLNTTNANNLTANGSAVATNPDSPFANAVTAGTQEYGIIQSVSYSTNTTVVVQVPEGCAIPTSGGVSTVYYSTARVPYAFVADSSRYDVVYISRTGNSQAVPTLGTWYNNFASGSTQLTVPIGSWRVDYNATIYNGYNGGASDIYATLSTGAATESEIDMTVRNSTNGTNGAMQNASREKSFNLSSATTYYLNIKAGGGTGAGSAIYTLGDQAATIVRAKQAYI